MDLYAITAPGLEEVCAAELRSLDIAPGARVEDGGVAWTGDARSLYRANLESRTASRVVLRVAEFRARTFPELERHAAKVDWASHIARGSAVALRVTCRKSRLYHQGAVAERLERALAAAVDARPVARSGDEDDDVADAQLLVVRFFRDVCTISLDASGALLHRRGYRQALAKAPLRENVAAALLLALGWRGERALLDPMCGSGTIPTEAALIARDIAPGLASSGLRAREFAFEKWPSFDASLWGDVVNAARARVRPSAGVPILGSDRDAGAVTASTANAARAGVADDISFEKLSVSAVRAPAASGLLVGNPPYGVRVGERRSLGPLYRAVGDLARGELAGWSVALLVADASLAGAAGLPFEEVLATRNGGIAVRLVHAGDRR